MSDTLDDLAAFLMHRSADDGRTEADRLAIYAVVAAYQEGYDVERIGAVLRTAAAPFADHAGYDPRWAPGATDQAVGVPVLERLRNTC